MRKSPQVNITVSSQRLWDDFRAACRRRGLKYSTVLSAAMRYYILHPTANGWMGKGGNFERRKSD